MNRRTALVLSLLLGGLAAPGRARAQQVKGRSTTSEPDGVPVENRRSRANLEDGPDTAAPPALAVEPEAKTTLPDDFPTETGHQFRSFDISRYTGLPQSSNSKINPQQAILDWVIRRTRAATWHGESLSALSASRAQLRVYHSDKVIRQVADMVERFTNAVSDFLSVRVRFVAAADPRWRYAVYSRLNAVGSGPQGQQIWTLRLEDAAMVMAQMQIDQRFRLLHDQRVEMVNGQTLNIVTSVKRNYVAGLQREGAVGFGFQPNIQQLEEGISLSFSPLLNFDGDGLDAWVDLRANTVQSLIHTKIIAPREVGPSEMTIDVPEVTESRLDQNIANWPLGQTLLLSGGIHPGILQSKTGFLRLPGTTPSSTELLVFMDVETVNRARLSRSRD